MVGAASQDDLGGIPEELTAAAVTRGLSQAVETAGHGDPSSGAGTVQFGAHVSPVSSEAAVHAC